jgi:hypothetical protein
MLGTATASCQDDASCGGSLSAPAVVSRGLITASFNRYIDTASDSPFEQFSLMGVFVRHEIEQSYTARSLFDSALSDLDLALDRCTMPSRVLDGTSEPATGGGTPIELLDVGDLSLSVDSKARLIPTRTFPDLLKVIVGVIYMADDTQEVVFRPGKTFDLQASGADAIAPFRVALEAPLDLGEIKIDGAIPGEQVPVVRRGEDVEITWEGDSYGDEVVATLGWMSMGAPWSMTCRMRDDGLFVLPASHTASLPDPLTCSDQDLTITRIRQVAFFSKGLSSGSFVFLVSTYFPVAF